MRDKGRYNLKPPVQLIVSWLFLNLLINLDYPLEYPLDYPAFSGLSAALLTPSLEIWVLLLVLSLAVLFKTAGSARTQFTLVLAVVFLRLFRIGDTLVPAYLSRPFNLYIDSGYIPDLLHLLYHSLSLPRLILLAPVTLALTGALLWGIHHALNLAMQAFLNLHLRRLFWGLTVLQGIWVGLWYHGALPFDTNFPMTTFSPRLMEEAAFILKIGEIERKELAAIQTAGARIPHGMSPLIGLNKRDVHLIFIESYGETLFSDPTHAPAFAPTVQAFETELEKTGFAVCSRYLESPTLGGSSWLGFGTLESGVWLPGQLRYNYLLKSDVMPLAGYFNQAGYRTVSVMPGTTLPWPEGKYFKYSQTYYAKDLAYRGPSFAWSPMPDQYALHYIYTRELASRRGPLFIRYMLTSSHAPFSVQPPYVSNWDEIGSGEIYHRLPPSTFSSDWPELKEGGRAYVAAIRYEFTVLQDYLSRFVRDETVVIILGDHQPVAQIMDAAASNRVPVHVICRNRTLLDPFNAMGYIPGMIPRRELLEKGMNDFLVDFLTAFSVP
jgi:hypothetical protein